MAAFEREFVSLASPTAPRNGAGYQSQAIDPTLKPLLGVPVPEATMELLTDWFDPSVTDENDQALVDPNDRELEQCCLGGRGE